MRFTAIAAVIVVLTAATPARAQTTPSADEEELAAYALTMPTLKRVMAAMRAMAEAMGKPRRK